MELKIYWIGSQFYPIINKLSNKCQRRFNCCQSGKISQNLVILPGISFFNFESFKSSKRRYYPGYWEIIKIMPKTEYLTLGFLFIFSYMVHAKKV